MHNRTQEVERSEIMNKPKLIVMDIDGTLRGKGHGTIGPFTKKAFEQLHEQGVLLGIASGRPLWQEVSHHYQEWELPFQFDLLIGMNGSELVDTKTNQRIESYLLSEDTLHDIVDKMHFLNLNPFVYRDGYMLSLREDEMIKASANRHMGELVICKEESELWSEPTAKILYRCETAEKGEEVEKFARTICNENFTCFRTGPELLEFQDPNINKGVAVQKYCDLYNISMSEVLAFGDAENDLQMLEMAGHSVCLLDGMDNVKAISDEITEFEADEDGVGHYLFDHVLNQ